MKFLYKYRRMNSKNLERTFTHYELYFNSPANFNDPFDCKPPFSITDYNESDIRDYYKKSYYETRFQNKCPELSDSQLEKETENFLKLFSEKPSCFMSAIAKRFRETCHELNSKLGILCLCQKPNDILMWSHYADSHHGIVLQFDKSAIENEKKFNYCKEVDYENNIITLRDINKTIPKERAKERARLILLKKADRWGYEKEWRIITDPSRRDDFPDCRIFTYPKEALTGVIFGCLMSPDDKYTVAMWLKEGNHKAQIFQAKERIDSYSIQIDPPIFNSDLVRDCPCNN